MNQLERIEKMEGILDRAEAALADLRKALENYQGIEDELNELADYYENGLWQKDHEDDETGRLPSDLKRGILSEDGIWNLLVEQDALLLMMKRAVKRQALT